MHHDFSDDHPTTRPSPYWGFCETNWDEADPSPTHTTDKVRDHWLDDGSTTKAAGQGYAHACNNTTNEIDKILFVYSPKISRTIFSLDEGRGTFPTR